MAETLNPPPPGQMVMVAGPQHCPGADNSPAAKRPRLDIPLEGFHQGFKGAAAGADVQPLSTHNSGASRTSKGESPLSLADGLLGSISGAASLPQVLSTTPISTNALLRSFSWPEPGSPGPLTAASPDLAMPAAIDSSTPSTTNSAQAAADHKPNLGSS